MLARAQLSIIMSKYFNKLTLATSLFLCFMGLIGLSYHVHHLEKQQLAELQAELERTVVQPAVTVNREHLRCLALNIYHEAGSEPFMGQVAVARVVMNRVKHGFASNPCKVVYQANWVPNRDDPEEAPRKVCQFSWVCEGKPAPHQNNPRYKQAESIAHDVLAENRWHDAVPGNVLFFHNSTVNPQWVYNRVMTIGNHVFYSRGRPQQPKTIKTTHQD